MHSIRASRLIMYVNYIYSTNTPALLLAVHCPLPSNLTVPLNVPGG
jgi:hypothetical protein